MVRNLILCIGFILLLSISACAKSTANNANPEELYKNDKSIDLLVYNDTSYVNATDIDWVTELELKSGEKLGKIERTSITKDFKNFDATLLEVGTEVYSVLDRDDIILVLIDSVMVPYLAYVEG